MGLQLPKRGRRIGALAAVSSGLLLLGACSSEDRAEIKRLAMPVHATDRAELIQDLWNGAWLAAMIVGVLVWGLIIYAAIRFRRRSDDEIPVQTRYNLPIEILYTVAPVIMVLVLFFFTVQTQNKVLATASESGPPDHTIEVVGQQWSWTFNYTNEDVLGSDDKTNDVYVVGTTADQPTLVLPKGESVRVNLNSPDVIHSFWVPAFLMKMDVIPGRHNGFEFTPTREGTYAGRCAELCGTYHSRMLFNLEVVSPEEYDQYLQGLKDDGNVGIALGASDAQTKAGLKDTQQNEEVQDDDTAQNGAGE
ncbi:MAG TPA: cytochrome c oxidase subunit II [Nocardioidaceae bacterium]|nr:cytochrome c oxidase subunit II [Nocardioidaceae bacterium]